MLFFSVRFSLRSIAPRPVAPAADPARICSIVRSRMFALIVPSGPSRPLRLRACVCGISPKYEPNPVDQPLTRRRASAIRSRMLFTASVSEAAFVPAARLAAAAAASVAAFSSCILRNSSGVRASVRAAEASDDAADPAFCRTSVRAASGATPASAPAMIASEDAFDCLGDARVSKKSAGLSVCI